MFVELWNFKIKCFQEREFHRKLPVDMAYQYFDLIDSAFKGRGNIVFVDDDGR